MRVGHWDAGFGISGDMALGSLLDAGAPAEAVSGALAALGVPGLRVEVGRAARCGVDCARVHIRWEGGPAAEGDGATAPGVPPESAGAGAHAHDDGQNRARGPERPRRYSHAPHRAYAEVRRLLAASGLPGAVRERAEAVFARLAEAEGRVHGVPAERVHLHEVGAEDALGDVVGTAAALEALGIGDLTVSPLPTGGGSVVAAHGRLPVPAPAVALLLRGFAVRPGPVEAELVTPTGAAIVAALGRPARTWPAMAVGGSGWGAGARDFDGHPNACRFVWGDAEGPADWTEERLVEMETNLDDQTPEAVGHLYDRLFSAGALDVATAPIWMKKQRPGVRLWALVRPADAEPVARCLFAESTAIGLRTREVRRWSLARERVAVATPYGEVRIKVARMRGREVNAAPEYEDCRAAAEASGVPLKTVFAAALAVWAARG